MLNPYKDNENKYTKRFCDKMGDTIKKPNDTIEQANGIMTIPLVCIRKEQLIIKVSHILKAI